MTPPHRDVAERREAKSRFPLNTSQLGTPVPGCFCFLPRREPAHIRESKANSLGSDPSWQDVNNQPVYWKNVAIISSSRAYNRQESCPRMQKTSSRAEKRRKSCPHQRKSPVQTDNPHFSCPAATNNPCPYTYRHFEHGLSENHCPPFFYRNPVSGWVVPQKNVTLRKDHRQ